MKKSMVGFAVAAALSLALSAQAVTLYWDGNTTTADADGGTGTWNTSLTNWDDAATAGNNATWSNTNPDSAIFGGTAGTVTLGSTITAGTLTLNTASYIFDKATYNLTIASLSGSGAATFKGTGTFTITGSSSGYSGGITLGPGSNAATTDLVSVGANDSLGTGTVYLRGALLQASTAGLTIGNALDVAAGGARFGGTNSFTLSGGVTWENVSRTIANYSSNGSTVTLSGGITTVSGSVVAFDNAAGAGTGAPIVVSGAITGAGAVSLSNSHNTTLSGNNTYSGGASISAGTLNINSITALGATASTLTITGGTIDNTSGGAITLSNNNAQNWNGNFTFTGTKDLNLGTGAVAMNASRTVTVNGGNLTVGGIISGSGYSLTKAGSGTMTLSGANTYTGGTTLSAGTLNINSATALGTGTFTISGGTIDNTSGGAVTLSNNNAQSWNGNFTFTGTKDLNLGAGAVAMNASRTVTVNGGNLTVGGIISGSGYSLTKAGSGTMTLSGANTYTGGTTVSGGTLAVTGTNSSTGAITVGSGTMTVAGNWNNAGNVTINSGGILTIASGGLYRDSAGVGVYNSYTVQVNTGGTLNLASFLYNGDGGLGGNQDRGQYRVLNGGTINITGGTQSAAQDFYVANGSTGTFNMTTSGQTLTLSGNANSNIAIGGALTFGGAGNITVNEQIDNNTGAGSVVYAGSGTLTLGAANTFTGSLSANSGTVVVSSTLRSVTGVTANSGSTIQLNATNIFSGGHGSAVPNTIVLTASGTGVLQFNSGYESRIGNVTLNNGGTLTSNRGLSGYDYLLANTTTGAATVTVSGSYASAALMNGSGGIHLSGVQNFDVANITADSNADLTVSMVLGDGGTGSGTGGVNKTGAGTMKITTAPTYTGATTVAAGILELATANYAKGMATSGVTVSSGATFNINGINILYSGSSYIPITVNGGTVGLISTASGAHNHFGSLTLNGGTVWGQATSPYASQYSTFDSGVTVGGTATSTIKGNNASYGYGLPSGTSQVFTVASTGDASGVDLLISSPLLDAGGLTKAGAGTMVLSGNSSYTGNTIIRAGKIIAQNSNALSTSGTVTLNDASTGSSNTSLMIDSTAGSITIARPITIANQGTGTATLGSATSSGSNQAIFSGAITLNKAVTLKNSGYGDRLQFSGGISDTGDVTIDGTDNTKKTVFITTANTFNGNIYITGGGRLQLSDGSSTSTSFIPDSSSVNLNTSGAYFNLAKGGNNETMGALNGVAGTTVNGYSADTLTIGNGNGSGSYAGSISGSLAITKTGTGTQTLSGVNTYTRATTVSGGTLNVTGSLAAGSSVGVGSAATLAGTGTANGGVTINSGGILAPGVSGAGTLTLGSLTLGSSAGDVSTISIGITGSPGSAVTSSALQVNGNITANGGAGKATIAFGSALANLGNGTYNLVTYTGTQLSDLSAFAWSGSKGAREGVTLVNGTKTIDLTITTAYPIWTGGTTDWSAGSGAWKLNTDNTDTYFLSDDTVHFDGTASSGTVNLTADVNPITVTFEGNTVNYTVGSSSGYKITTGQIIKTGDSTLTINNANTFSGGTTLSGGTLTLGDGGALGSGSIALNGGTLDINGKTIANGVVLGGGALVGNGGTINGAVSETGGARALTVGSSLTLAGVNTYTGATTITAGTLEIGGSGQLGSGSYSPNISNDGTLKVNTSASQTLAGIVSGTGALVKDNTGTLTLTGVNTYGGTTTINGGTLEIGGSGQLGSGSYAGNISNAGMLKVNTSANQTLSGIISGATGALVKANSGTLTLTGVNTYGGATTINGGTLEVGGSGQLGSGSYAGDISNAGTLKVNTSANQTLSGIVNGAGALIKDSTGTLTLTNVNTYTGATTISAGTLEIGGAGQLNSGSYAGNISKVGTLKFNSSANQTLSGTLSGAGALIKDNTGMLTISTVPTSTGNMTINGGTLKLTFGYSSSFATPSITINSGGTLDVAGQDVLYWTTGKGALTINGGTVTQSGTGYRQTLANTLTMTGGTLTSAGAGDTWANFSILGAGVSAASDASGNAAVISCQKLALQDSGGQTTFTVTRGAASPAVDLLVSGAIVNMNGSNNGLIKAGNGIMKMSAANTYTGATTLSAGTLILANQDALATTTLNYSSAGTLVFDSSVTGNAFSFGGLSGSSSIALQNNAGTPTAIALTLGSNNANSTYSSGGVLSGAGSLTKTGSGALYMAGTHTYSGTTTIAGTGYLEVSGGALSIANSVLNVTSSHGKAVDIWAGKLTVRGLTGTGTIVANGSNGNAFTGTALEIATPGVESYSFGGSLNNKSWSSGVMAIEKTGTGTQILTAGASDFTGGTKITDGKLSFASGSLGPSGAITMNGGTLRWESGNTQDISGRLTMVNSKAATLDTNGNNVTLGAGFGGATSGALTKTGTGMLTLAGANDYTGATSVNAGTLAVNGSLASTITVASTAQLQGSGNTTGGLIINGTVAPGNSIESLGAGDVEFKAASTFAYELDTSGTLGEGSGDLLYASGSLKIASGTLLTLTELSSGTLTQGEKLTLISYNGDWDGGLFTYDSSPLTDGGTFLLGSNYWRFDYNDITGGSNYTTDQLSGNSFVTMTVIPEPGTAGIVATFLAAALLRRRRFG